MIASEIKNFVMKNIDSNWQKTPLVVALTLSKSNYAFTNMQIQNAISDLIESGTIEANGDVKACNSTEIRLKSTN